MGRITSREARYRRHSRVRAGVKGTTDRPRLSVFRSLNHIYAQIIDDAKGNTLVTASTIDAEVKTNLDKKTKASEAEVVGAVLAKRALEKGINQVVFDRGGYKYHGRVKSLAEAARKGGLKF